jgi:prepilin-type N-terminal cleavage/methylation domain-containing protein
MRFVASRRAFTLVEIIVVVSIIAMLSGVVYFFASQSSAISRNADRQADLRRLQAAVEEFKRVNGRYPAGGCPAANGWSGESGVTFSGTAGCANYIAGLVPNFIDRLPADPRRGGCTTDCGYAYITNTARDVYKIIVMNTVEGDALVTYSHPLKSCDLTGSTDNNIAISGLCRFVCADQSCGTGRIDALTNNTHPCNYSDPVTDPGSDTRFERSYAVWGGFAALSATVQNSLQCDSGVCVDESDPFTETKFIPYPNSLPAGSIARLRMRAVYNTTQIICR